LVADLIPNSVAILQYTDDTILCFEHYPEKAINVKLLLYVFELMSGLKINFMKSKVFVVNADNEANAVYASMFNCQVGTLPVKYLGVPVTFANLKNVERDFVDAKMIKKLAAWICDSATSGGRLTLLQSCLTGIRSILVATNIDVSKHILVIDASILVTST
jgi:mannosylglycoprotein endo-beta-mannosidase